MCIDKYKAFAVTVATAICYTSNQIQRQRIINALFSLKYPPHPPPPGTKAKKKVFVTW